MKEVEFGLQLQRMYRTRATSQERKDGVYALFVGDRNRDLSGVC